MIASSQRIPEGDRTFLKEDVGDPDVRRELGTARGARAIAVEGGEVVGDLSRSCRCTAGRATSARCGSWSIPSSRGRGIGRALARRAVLDAMDMGLAKLVVEVIADQEALIGMFRALGFEPEALLTDHVRDRSGELRDLMVLANSVESSSRRWPPPASWTACDGCRQPRDGGR